jgi:hypothetical protein
MIDQGHNLLVCHRVKVFDVGCRMSGNLSSEDLCANDSPIVLNARFRVFFECGDSQGGFGYYIWTMNYNAQGIAPK